MTKNRAKWSLLAVVLTATTGCGVTPRSKFDEARRSVPEIREYALQNLPDLTPAERELVQNREPVMGQANYVAYYFWWKDERGRTVVTVDATAPPCRPTRAYRNAGRQANARLGY
jgi:hypothetical protein